MANWKYQGPAPTKTTTTPPRPTANTYNRNIQPQAQRPGGFNWKAFWDSIFPPATGLAAAKTILPSTTYDVNGWKTRDATLRKTPYEYTLENEQRVAYTFNQYKQQAPPPAPGRPFEQQPEGIEKGMIPVLHKGIPVSYEATYWENPRNIARAYMQYRSAKPGDVIPDWYDPETFEQAYKYLEVRNNGAPWYEWKYLNKDDPGRSYLQTLQDPPMEYALPKNEYQRWLTAKLMQEDPNAWDFQELMKLPPEVRMALQEQKRALALKTPYEDMPMWQKLNLRAMSSPAVQGGAAMLPFAIPGAISGATTGAAGGATIGTFIAPGVGTAIGGILGGVGGGILGGATPVAMGAGLGWASQKSKTAANLLMMLDYPATWMEQAMSVGLQAAASKTNSDVYGSLDELINNLPAAWQAGRLGTETGSLFSYGKESPAARAGLYSIMGLDPETRGRFDITNVMPAINYALAFMTGNREEIEKIRFAGPNQIFMPEQAEPVTLPAVGLVAMVNARREIMKGQDPVDVFERYSQEFGLSGQFSEMAGHIVFDPLNIMPTVGAKGIGKVAELAGNVPMAKAFSEAVGPVEGWRKYASMIQTGGAGPATELGAFEKFAAGLDDLGKIKVIAGDPATTAPFMRWVYRVADLVPSAKARLFVTHLADNVGVLLESMRGDPDGMVARFRAAATMDPSESYQIAKYLGSPEMYTAQGALRLAVADVEALLESYHGADNQRALLNIMIRIMGDPEKSVASNGAEILKMLRSSDNADVLFRAMNDRINALDPNLAAELRADPGFTAEGIKGMLDAFTGKDPVPWHPDEFAAQVWGITNSKAADWSVQTFGVKPDATIYRFFDVLKRGQSLVLLGFNPNYLIGNEMGNIVGRAATGIWGYVAEGTIHKFINRMGVEPYRFEAGVGASGIVTEQRLKKEVGAASVGEAIGKSGETGDEAIRLATVEQRGLLTKMRNAADTAGKLGVISKGSRVLEVKEGMQAWYAGLKKTWNWLWTVDNEIPRMPPDVVDWMRRNNIDPNHIYRTIEGSMNVEEIRAGLFGDVAKYSLDNVLGEVSRQLNMDLPMARDTLDDIYIHLRDEVGRAQTPDDIRSIFSNLESKVQDHYDDLIRENLAQRAQQVTQQTAGGGFAEALRLWEEMHFNTQEYWIRHFDEWEHAYEMKAALREQGASAASIDRVFRQRMQDAKRQWKRVRDFEKTTSESILDGLGIDEANVRRYGGMMDDVGKAWDDYFKLKDKEYQQYFKDERNNKYATRAEADAAWQEIEQRLNDEYIRTTEAVANKYTDMDELFITLTTDQFGENVGSTARWWREQIRDMRQHGTDQINQFRQTLVGQKGDARRTAWEAFLNDTYRPWVYEFFQSLDDGAMEVYKTSIGHPPPDGAPPANPGPLPPEPDRPLAGEPRGVDPEADAAMQRFTEYLNNLSEDEGVRTAAAEDFAARLDDAINRGELRLGIDADAPNADDAARWQAFKDAARSRGYELADPEVVSQASIQAESPRESRPIFMAQPEGTRITNGGSLYPWDVVKYDGKDYVVTQRFPDSVWGIDASTWEPGPLGKVTGPEVQISLKDNEVVSAGYNMHSHAPEPEPYYRQQVQEARAQLVQKYTSLNQSINEQQAGSMVALIEANAAYKGMSLPQYVTEYVKDIIFGPGTEEGALYKLTSPGDTDQAAYRDYLDKSPSLVTEDVNDYYNRTLQWIKDNTGVGESAIKENEKTILSIDMTGICPYTAAGRPCLYCYVENPRSLSSPQMNVRYEQAGYRPGALLEMPDEFVNFVNDKLGGMRVFSIGDIRPQDVETLHTIIREGAARADQGQTPLQFKFITKQLQTMKEFGQYDNVVFNMSVDWRPQHFDKAMEPLIRERMTTYYYENIYKQRNPDVDPAKLSDKAGTKTFLKSLTPEEIADVERKVAHDIETARLYIGDPTLNKVISYGWSMEDPAVLEAAGIDPQQSALYWRNLDSQKYMIRSVAMNERDALLYGLDPNIDVVTMWHGSMTDPRKNLELMRIQNPYLAGIGPELTGQLVGFMDNLLRDRLPEDITIQQMFEQANGKAPLTNEMYQAMQTQLGDRFQALVDYTGRMRSATQEAAFEQAMKEKLWPRLLEVGKVPDDMPMPATGTEIYDIAASNRKVRKKPGWKLSKDPMWDQIKREAPRDTGAGIVLQQPVPMWGADVVEGMGGGFGPETTIGEMVQFLNGYTYRPQMSDRTVMAITSVYRQKEPGEFWLQPKPGETMPKMEGTSKNVTRATKEWMEDVVGKKITDNEFIDTLDYVVSKIYCQNPAKGRCAACGVLCGKGPLRLSARARQFELPEVFWRLMDGEPVASIAFDMDGRAVMRAFNDSTNVTDMTHELGHLFRRTLNDEDLAALESEMHVTPGQWQVEHEEKFADLFEKYLSEGRAPTPQLATVFQRFKNWIVNLFNSLTGRNQANLSPEMRRIMDKMLTPAEGSGIPVEMTGQMRDLGRPAPPTPSPLAATPDQLTALARQYRVITATENNVPLQTMRNIVNKFLRGEYGGEPKAVDGTTYERRVLQNINEAPVDLVQDALDARLRFYRNTQGAGNAVGPFPPGVIESLGYPEYRGMTEAHLWEQRVRPILEGLEDGLINNTNNTNIGGHQLPPDIQGSFNGWMNQVEGNMSSAKIASIRWAENLRDQAMLNYSKLRGFDTIGNVFFPYQYFYTRSMFEWALRGIDRPKWFANYARLRNYQRNLVNVAGYPTRLRDKIAIPAPYLPDWAGGEAFIDPLRQAFYPEGFFSPIDRAASDQSDLENRAAYILQKWVNDGRMSRDAAVMAIQNRSGQQWEMAVAEAQKASAAEESNPLDFLSMMFGPAYYLTMPAFLATGKDIVTGRDDISILPFTKTGRSLKAITKNTPLHSIGQAVGSIMAWPEEALRKARGLSEFGDWGPYYVDRMLANMAAEGNYSSNQVIQAMIERDGNPIYEEAADRVRLESALKTGGGLSAYATLHGAAWNNPGDFAAAILFGWMPAGLLPEGELAQRQLSVLYKQAREQYNAGDRDALNNFMDQHPEYQARLALYDEPEERLRQFLLSEVWDRYTNLSSVDKQTARDDLGDLFGQNFLSKETRNYDTLDNDTLATWARYLGGTVPAAGDVQDIATASDIDFPSLATAPPEDSATVDAYHQLRNQLFPNWYAVQSMYYSYPQGSSDRKQVLSQFPWLKDYWDWNKKYKAANPVIAQYTRKPEDTVSPQYDLSFVKEFTPAMSRSLMGYYYMDQPLSDGSLRELGYLWNKYNRPGGDFDTFIDEVLPAAVAP